MTALEIWNGDSRKVIVPRQAVALFNAQWPCSTLRPSRAYAAELSAAHGLTIKEY